MSQEYMGHPNCQEVRAHKYKIVQSNHNSKNKQAREIPLGELNAVEWDTSGIISPNEVPSLAYPEYVLGCFFSTLTKRADWVSN